MISRIILERSRLMTLMEKIKKFACIEKVQREPLVLAHRIFLKNTAGLVSQSSFPAAWELLHG